MQSKIYDRDAKILTFLIYNSTGKVRCRTKLRYKNLRNSSQRIPPARMLSAVRNLRWFLARGLHGRLLFFN